MIKNFYVDCIKTDKELSTTFSFIYFFFPKILLGIVGFILSLHFFFPLGDFFLCWRFLNSYTGRLLYWKPAWWQDNLAVNPRRVICDDAVWSDWLFGFELLLVYARFPRCEIRVSDCGLRTWAFA